MRTYWIHTQIFKFLSAKMVFLSNLMPHFFYWNQLLQPFTRSPAPIWRRSDLREKFALKSQQKQQTNEKFKNNLRQKSQYHESRLIKLTNIINKIVRTNRIVELNAYYFQTGKQKTRDYWWRRTGWFRNSGFVWLVEDRL